MKWRSGNSSFPNPSFAGRFTVLLYSKKAIGKPRVPLDYPLMDVNRKCLPVLKTSLVEWKLSKKIAIIQGNLSLLSRINWCKKQSLWSLRACAYSPFESREKCIPARGKPRLARAWLYKVCHRLAIEQGKFMSARAVSIYIEFSALNISNIVSIHWPPRCSFSFPSMTTWWRDSYLFTLSVLYHILLKQQLI